MKRKLTARQEAFANCYLDGSLNGAENYRIAYKKFGCSDAQAASEAYRLRHHPLVAGYIREGQRWLSDYREGLITRAEYAHGLSRLSRDGPTDYHISQGVLSPICRRVYRRRQVKFVWKEEPKAEPRMATRHAGAMPEPIPATPIPPAPEPSPRREPSEDAFRQRRQHRHEVASSGGLRL